MREISLSWLVVDTRCYIKDLECYLDSEKGICYAAFKPESKKDICRKNNIEDSSKLILLPELYGYSIEDAANYLRSWCADNNIPFKEDLDNYKTVERHYWGYDDEE